MHGHCWLGIGLITLGIGVAANALLGPLVANVIRYRFSETLINQGIGLDAVSLLVVAPLSVAAGILALRSHPGAPMLALAPATYVAYMAVQYVVGPEYLHLAGNNERFFPLHLGLFILSGAIAVRAWAAIDPARLDPLSRRTDRSDGAVLFGLGALLALRYLPGLIDLMSGEPTLPEYRANPTSFFLIATMDLGIVMPTAIAAGLALMRGAGWARKALYAIIGWFALVGATVAAMATAMVVNDDPHASTGQMLGFIVAAAILGALAVRLYWPHVGRHPGWVGRGAPKDTDRSRGAALCLLMVALLLQGLSGVLGGLALVVEPSGGLLHLPVSWLHGSPFRDFLIPGLVLLVGLGMFPVIVVYALWARRAWSRRAALLVGAMLIVWIAVQIRIIGYRPWPPLQLIYGLLGIGIVVLALLPTTRARA